MAWFSILMPWDKLPDPDAFYHATMAKLTWKSGPVTSFPWLDLTSLGSHFADQHFLFHVIQSPFVALLGLTQGSSVSSLLLATLSLLGLAFVFYRLRLKPFWLWPILLALSNPFSTRMVLGKASPLAVLLWMIGLAAVINSSPWIIFTVSFLFALTHGGWIILPGSILILIVGQALHHKAIDNQSWFASIKSANWTALLSSLLGIASGILIHPGRSELLSLLWVQVIKIGVLTPQNILPMGIEWEAASPGAFIAMTSVFGIILLLIVPGLIFARNSQIRDRMKLIVSLSFLIAVLVALTFKSSRFAEYLQPALAVWTAALAQLVDWKKLFAWLQMEESRLFKYLVPGVIAIATLLVLANSVAQGYSSLHSKPEFKDDQYLAATQAISNQAKKGDRVFHSQWDEFPVLFSRNQDLKYVAGLDPNFFY
ncbi:MAG: hypothetical protein PHC70_05350, partial [Patescibacteria group bacterium]|nr:hypothetical protein [Patescibacteria group bacterium]